MDKSAKDGFADSATKPYVPAQQSGTGIDVDVQLRIAHALEYIAAQVGQISELMRRQEQAKAVAEAEKQAAAAIVAQEGRYEKRSR